MDILYVGLGNAAAATVFALLAALVGRFCRGRPALVRSLWLLVLLRLLAPPLLCPRVAWPAPLAPVPDPAATAEPSADLPAPLPAEPPPLAPPEPEALAVTDPQPDPGKTDLRAAVDVPPPPPVTAELLPAPAVEPPAAPPLPAPSWQQVALGAWLAGSVVWWLIAARRLVRFGRMARHARPAPAAVQEAARRLALRLGLARCPPVLFVPGQVPPLLWGVVGRPRVLLPAALWARLTPEQQETLLAHELAHLRRGDHWVRRLELVALGLYWWHPVAWWARRRIQEAEEECCDACVVAALPGAAAAYARALLTTIAFLSDTRAALPVGASGVGQAPVLKRRLAMILQGTTPRGLSRAGVAAVLGLAAVLLPLLPTWGQAPPPGDKPTPNVTTPAASDAPDTPLSDKPDSAGHPAPAPANAAPRFRSFARGAADYEEQPAGATTAEEQVELLRAQLDVRRAELEETKALLDQASRRLARTEELFKRGAVDTGVHDDARTDVAVLEARLRGKEARVREVEVQLRQAQRRAGSSPSPRPRPAPTRGDYGRANPPVVRPPAAARELSLEARPVPPPPAAAAPPAPAPVPPPPRPGADPEARLRELEKKIDGLLREVESLRREMHRPRGPAGASDTDPPQDRDFAPPRAIR